MVSKTHRPSAVNVPLWISPTARPSLTTKITAISLRQTKSAGLKSSQRIIRRFATQGFSKTLEQSAWRARMWMKWSSASIWTITQMPSIGKSISSEKRTIKCLNWTVGKDTCEWKRSISRKRWGKRSFMSWERSKTLRMLIGQRRERRALLGR